MKTETILSVLKVAGPIGKKYLLPILFRLSNPASKFFRPLVIIGAKVAVLSAVLVAIKDQIGAPGWLQVAIEIVAIISPTVAGVSALTLDDAGVARLKQLMESDGLAE